MIDDLAFFRRASRAWRTACRSRGQEPVEPTDYTIRHHPSGGHATITLRCGKTVLAHYLWREQGDRVSSCHPDYTAGRTWKRKEKGR
jgi:hypothetical protein